MTAPEIAGLVRRVGDRRARSAMRASPGGRILLMQQYDCSRMTVSKALTGWAPVA